MHLHTANTPQMCCTAVLQFRKCPVLWLGQGTFTMTCLHWILGYIRLEIWRKIGLSGD